MTLKEYSSSRGIPYDTVRKQFQKYRPLLEKNITKKGRASDLNKEAVEFLDSKQKSKPMSVLHREQMRLLKKNIEDLNEKVTRLENMVLELDIKLSKYIAKNESMVPKKMKVEEKKQEKWFKKLLRAINPNKA